jgi:hypothetical protein
MLPMPNQNMAITSTTPMVYQGVGNSRWKSASQQQQPESRHQIHPLRGVWKYASSTLRMPLKNAKGSAPMKMMRAMGR